MRDSLTWRGVIVARTWPAGMSERDLLLLEVGGRASRLAHPDAESSTGAPIYVLGDRDARAAQRLLDRECLSRIEAHNLLTAAGRTVMLNFLSAQSGLSGITYFAVGSGTTAPTPTDTTLSAETFRKQITSLIISGASLTLTTLFAVNEANTTYGECGLFGNGATATANSGTLFAHALYPYVKASGTTLTNQYSISLN